MTFEVDNEALKVAMARHYEEKLAKELREMFMYSGNEDTARIWQLYLQEIQRKAEEQVEPHPFHKWFFFALCGGILFAALKSLWHLFTSTPT